MDFFSRLQGTLTRSYSTVTYYKDINTLQELDASGLPIGTTSGSLGSIFEQSYGVPLIESLASKFQMQNTIGDATIDRTAYAHDICSIERLTDVLIIIAVYLK